MPSLSERLRAELVKMQQEFIYQKQDRLPADKRKAATEGLSLVKTVLEMIAGGADPLPIWEAMRLQKRMDVIRFKSRQERLSEAETLDAYEAIKDARARGLTDEDLAAEVDCRDSRHVRDIEQRARAIIARNDGPPSSMLGPTGEM